MLVSGVIGPVNSLADLLMLLDVTGQLKGLRILEEGLGHSQHLPFQRRGKQQGLPLFGDRSHNSSYIANEPHVQHAIGFIQYQKFQARKIQTALPHVIQ